MNTAGLRDIQDYMGEIEDLIRDIRRASAAEGQEDKVKGFASDIYYQASNIQYAAEGLMR